MASLVESVEPENQAEIPPPKKKYHFFISKHEKYKDRAENIANTLKNHGYIPWLSNWEDEVDAESMQHAVDDSDAVLLVCSPGIFHKDRSWVTHTEIKYAIDLGKPIILVDGGVHFGPKAECGHSKECCVDVQKDFQPYARMLSTALERVPWHGSAEYREVDVKKIIRKFNARHESVAKMKRYLEKELEKGPCSYNSVNHASPSSTSSKSFTQSPTAALKVPTLTRSTSTPNPWDLPEGKKYHFFLCHHQGSGGDIVGLLHAWLEKWGYKCWRDQDRDMADRNVDGMIEGVQKSFGAYLLFINYCQRFRDVPFW